MSEQRTVGTARELLFELPLPARRPAGCLLSVCCRKTASDSPLLLAADGKTQTDSSERLAAPGESTKEGSGGEYSRKKETKTKAKTKKKTKKKKRAG